MKYIIYIILTIGMFAVSALPTDWSFSKKTHGTSVWKLKSNPEVIGVYFSEKALPGTDWSKVKSKSIFKKWEEPKKKIMEAVGVTNWKASRYSWKKEKSEDKKNQYLFSVTGSYVGKDKKKIFFREEHLYKDGKTLQLLITSPQKKFVKKSRMITQLFNHAKSEMKVEKKQEKQKPESEKVSYQDKTLIHQYSFKRS